MFKSLFLYFSSFTLFSFQGVFETEINRLNRGGFLFYKILLTKYIYVATI